MITDYYRPDTLEEALQLITHPKTYPMGGGTFLNQQEGRFSVVDLQALKLNTIRKTGTTLSIGSMVTLQKLFESDLTPPALKLSISLELPLNLRNMATIGGSLVICAGRSPFLGSLLAMDASIILNEDEKLSLGDFLTLREKGIGGKIITKLNLRTDMSLAYEQISRTPADKPILYTSLAYWSSSRIRLVLGGWGKLPSLALDGQTNAADLEQVIMRAAMNAAHDASDEWASREYRLEMAPILAKRCLEYCIQNTK